MRSLLGRERRPAPGGAVRRALGELPPKNQRVFDAESFLEELGSRAGAESARIAEDLIDWALRKDQELERAGFRVASLDRLPTASGDIPELWVQLDLRRPQGLQYTLRAHLLGDDRRDPQGPSRCRLMRSSA